MLSEEHLRGLEKRGISAETAQRFGLYSGKRGADGADVQPSERGEILCFPFVENGEEVAVKYRSRRDGERVMWQKPNGRKTLYNAQVLIDPETRAELESGAFPLIVTEGETDTLSFAEAGCHHVVSIQSGAPPARDKNGLLIDVPENADDITPEEDTKFTDIWANWQYLKNVKRIVIATDADEPGRRLERELVRRFGAVRCSFVEYPEGCKDANDVLRRDGPDMLRSLVDCARPIPVKGLYRLQDYPEADEPIVYSTGFEGLDEYCRVYPGAFAVVTGIPGFGKSTLVNQIACNLVRLHGWRVTIASLEMPTVPYIRKSLRAGFLHLPPQQWTRHHRDKADMWINENFSFIDIDLEPLANDDADVDWLIEKASDAVIRYGSKVLILDPWNEIEHRKRKDQTTTEYVGESIRKLKRFARSYECLVIVVAHPAKMKSGEEPGLYDISDSAHWFNKPDIGIVVHADSPMNMMREIKVKKVRFSSAGKRGTAYLEFDPQTELYYDSNMRMAAE